MIEVRGVSKRFGATFVLRAISFEVRAGQTLVVVGPNGAGKSTLLRVLAGILRPSEGEVTVGGLPPRLKRASIGYLGHDPFTYPHLTAAENLAFFAALYGAAPARADRLLGEVGLAAKADLPAGRLSHGEGRRLGLARALLHDPDLLVVDEPFAGLDRESARAIPDLVRRDGRTVVIATHDVDGAAALPGSVIGLAEGRVR